MKRLSIIAAAGALVFIPALAVAQGAGGGGMGHSSTMGPSSSPSSMHSSSMSSSSTNSTSTNTTQRGPSSTGQPSQDCADFPGMTPGNSASAPGSAFNPDGTSGTKYAGEQPQNSGNTASVSQYDTACSHQK